MKKAEIGDHLRELKKRVVIAFLAYIVACCITFQYASTINDFLLKPLSQINIEDGSNRRLIFTGLAEGFLNHIHIAMYSGFILAFPIVAWQIYFFIAPGLYRSEKKIIIPFFIASPSLFFIGSALAYYYLIPTAWRFFLSFEQHGAMPILLEARISEYLSTMLEIVIGFGMAFQLPLIMIILVKLGVVTSETLSRKRKYAIVAIFIIAAILTPPDVLSQISLAIPLLLLYEISLLICHKFENKKE